MMTDERVEEVLFDINGKLSAISTKLDTLSGVVVGHESRIQKLEDAASKADPKTEDSFKTEMLKLLAKSVMIGLIVIASLTGASSIIKETFSRDISSVTNIAR